MRRTLLLLVPLLLTGCRAAELPRRHLLLSGSPSLTPLMRDVAARFQERHPHLRLDISSENVERAIADTRVGLVDIALVGRALRTNEADLGNVVIARDGLAFLVHRSNPVPPPDEKQLVALLTRVYTDWAEVGGSAGPVRLVGVEQGRGLREALLRRFDLASVSVRPDPAFNRSEQVIEAVGRDPQALGYVSLAEASKAAQTARLLPQGGVPATVENLRDGRYPYARPLVLAFRTQGDELTRPFLDFARSAEVHDLIEKHGFAPPPAP